MILYINGDSHSAGAEAATPYAFAEDDHQYFFMGRAPHPANLQVSWGKRLSDSLNTGMRCDAESASSNTRILRTSRDWLKNQNYTKPLVIIQWSTWEREEWLIDGIYYQINASGIDDVPNSHQQAYKEYVANIDWQSKTEQAHKEIWEFHQELLEQNIPHIIFNGNNNFSTIKEHKDWGKNYIFPYNPSKTFDTILRTAGFETVAPNSYHFGKDAHSFFHRFMLQYIIDNKFI